VVKGKVFAKKEPKKLRPFVRGWVVSARPMTCLPGAAEGKVFAKKEPKKH